MSGPPNKWIKLQVSTTADSNAESSDWVLSDINANWPYSGSFTAVCSDGTYVFLGYYSS
jgi:hypothetical protein